MRWDRSCVDCLFIILAVFMTSSCILTICQACQTLFEEEWRDHTSQKYESTITFEKRAESDATIELQHHNVLQLKLSVTNDCSMCVLVLRELERRNEPERLRSLREANYLGAQIWCSKPNDAIFRIRFDYSIETFLKSHWCFMFMKIAQSNRGIAIIWRAVWVTNQILEMTKKMSVSDTWFEESFSTALSWMKKCKKDRVRHKKCWRIQQARHVDSDADEVSLPSRLIEVRGSKQNVHIHLREKRHMTGNEQYMTLSHCWGKSSSKSIMLTQNSLASFLKKIDHCSLSCIFQNAVQVVQIFDINFLWIDALCILQDSREDWLTESASMTDVYVNSFLNIAATIAVDSQSGLFQTSRRQISENVIDISISWIDDLAADQYVCYEMKLFESEVDRSSLCQRAWVVQKREMTSHVLHFTKNHLIWKCSCSAAIDALSMRLNRQVNFKRDQARLYDTSSLNQFVDFSSYQYWASLVRQYAADQLTHSSNKLIAISTLAQSIMRLLRFKGCKDTYLAELWKNDLVIELLWCTRNIDSSAFAEGVRVSSETSSSSWSWASIHDSQIWYSNQKNVDEVILSQTNSSVIIIEARTFSLVSEFGTVSDEILRLKGTLCKISVSRDDSLKHWIINGSASLKRYEIRVMWNLCYDVREFINDLVFMFIRRNVSDMLQGRVEEILLSRIHRHEGQYTRGDHIDLRFDENYKFAVDDGKIWSSMNMPVEYYEQNHENDEYIIFIIWRVSNVCCWYIIQLDHNFWRSILFNFRYSQVKICQL